MIGAITTTLWWLLPLVDITDDVICSLWYFGTLPHSHSCIPEMKVGYKGPFTAEAPFLSKNHALMIQPPSIWFVDDTQRTCVFRRCALQPRIDLLDLRRRELAPLQ